MRPFRQLALDRRTFLRGAGCALALPWLDAMAPASRAAPPAPLRCLFVFSPNGMHMDEWRPEGEGRDAKLRGTLASLQPLRARLTVLTGLAIDGGFAHGDGAGDHARAGGSYLTCAHPRKTGGADLWAGVSIDQHIAAAVPSSAPFASLELGMEKGPSSGVCDSGYSCAYSSNISWRTPSTPVAKETDPRAAYARLFGNPQRASDAAAEARRRRRERSILDAVLADAKALDARLGGADRRKLDDYLQAVRELERRLQALDAEPPRADVPEGLLRDGLGYAERLRLMYDLLALAFATDRTRIATFMLGNAGSNRSYKFLDVPDGHHDLSHHGRKPEKLKALAAINRFHVEQFARFLGGLAERDGGAEGDLLAQSLIVFGSGIGDGDRHNHDDLPVLLAGEGGGAAKARGHVVLPKKTPMANLYLAVARAAGCRDAAFADSSGALAIG
jgi:hypothetical protein